ncbi:MAG: hypothetical protein ACK5HL_01885 [Bacilli bacterium]
MYEKIIEKYVNIMSLNDIKKFALNEGVNLTDIEAKIIYEAIKKDWKKYLNSDFTVEIEKLGLNTSLTNKIKNVVTKYKEKFKLK